ncbi:hypothetical protein AVEN_95559-1 [Araneus ventricosus]|uniref:Uncharacterized protein n=1 Tax=Araneus ventricosus TaxID=182803 RepID=A0A4Y2S6G3_ARAVE|nr:hypothetical protein AVEN_95559-1 [Araneus ventricosus]
MWWEYGHELFGSFLGIDSFQEYYLLKGLSSGKPAMFLPEIKRTRWPSGKVGSKPDSTEDPPCSGPGAREIMRRGQTSSRWCGAIQPTPTQPTLLGLRH